MALTKEYDKLFEQYKGDNLSVEFLRALGYWESNLNPSLSEAGAGWGILQVVEDVRGDFNEAHPNSHYNRQDLLRADVNIRIACWLLNLICEQWKRNHNDWWPGLAPDWKSDTWVELFVAGWNSGWSQYGIGKVVRYMARVGAIKRGDTPKLSLLARYAEGSGSVFAKYSQWNRTYAWAPKVVKLFREQQAEAELSKPDHDGQIHTVCQKCNHCLECCAIGCPACIA